MVREPLQLSIFQRDKMRVRERKKKRELDVKLVVCSCIFALLDSVVVRGMLITF